MSRFCFVHAADLRLDVPFTGVGRVPAATADALRDASLEAWDALVERTIERRAAFLILAGNLYEGPKRGVRARARLRAGFERLAERQIPVFVAAGPVDSFGEWARREWPATVTLFAVDRPGAVTVWRGGAALAVVHGMSCPTGGFGENPARAFHRGGGTGLQIGVVHAAGRHDVDAFRVAGLDYWALGGVDQRTVVRSGEPWIVYPGSPQGRSPADIGARGALVVEVDDGVIRTVAFEEIDRIRMLRLTADVDGVDGLIEKARRLREEHSGRTLLVEIEMPLEGPARDEFGDLPAREALVHELRRRVESWIPAFWWIGSRDRGALPEAALAPGCPDALVAEVLARGGSLAEDPVAAGRFLEARFEPLLGTWMAALEPAEVPSLVDDSTRLAVRFLARGDAR
jgi:exonuclease SbcD